MTKRVPKTFPGAVDRYKAASDAMWLARCAFDTTLDELRAAAKSVEKHLPKESAPVIRSRVLSITRESKELAKEIQNSKAFTILSLNTNSVACVADRNNGDWTAHGNTLKKRMKI